MRVCMCVCVCMRACVRVWVRACVCVCVCVIKPVILTENATTKAFLLLKLQVIGFRHVVTLVTGV